MSHSARGLVPLAEIILEFWKLGCVETLGPFRFVFVQPLRFLYPLKRRAIATDSITRRFHGAIRMPVPSRENAVSRYLHFCILVDLSERPNNRKKIEQRMDKRFLLT
jgi:hypothetical protein